ncbi:adenosylcobinamide-phosphate synthase CbiB [soil metagenome]
MSSGAPAPLLLALSLDLAVGEPPARIHPVVGMGKLVGLLARRAPQTPHGQLVYGAASVGLTTLIPALGASVLLGRLKSWPLRVATEAWLLKTCFAYSALEEAGRSVADPLGSGDLLSAREELRALVSRERSGLDESLISAAAIESLAENLSDGFVAPLLAYALGGLPAALFCRAANTADSMIGYRGEYEHLGKAAARLDDALNLLPARLTALLLAAASGAEFESAWSTFGRDRDKTASPNAGWPMAAAAGALGVSLRKPDSYCLNEAAREPYAKDIHRAISLVHRAAVLCAALALAVTVLGKKAA